jgi:endonuclease/exonuclease/phosphatase family metal-dependent hydrolase
MTGVLRLLNLNVWVLPLDLSRDVQARLERIGTRVAELAPDVVAYQEVWNAEAAATLIASGRAAGFEHVWQHVPGAQGSGLLVLSKLPIRTGRFEPYEARGRPERVWHGDWLGGKGFGDVVLETPRGRVRLVVTHLHAAYDDDAYDGTRLAQAIQLTAALRATELPVLATGDFNLEEDEVHHRVLTDLGGLRDVAAELDHREMTILSDNPYREDGAAEERIDYAFVRNGREAGLTPRRVERVLDGDFTLDGRRAAASDHAGLLAEIAWGPPAHLPTRSPRARRTVADATAVLDADLERTRSRQSSRRGLGVVSLLLALPAMFGGRRGVTRRRFLAGLLGLTGVGLLGLAEGPTHENVRALRRARERLAELLESPFV